MGEFNYREIRVESDEEAKHLIELQLGKTIPIPFDTFVYDFVNFYDKKGIMIEYSLLMDLEYKYKYDQTFINWKSALLYVMNGEHLTGVNIE